MSANIPSVNMKCEGEKAIRKVV